MHVHPTSIASASSLYAAATAEKSTEAQRAAKTRKRLMRAAQSAESFEEDSFTSIWRHSTLNQDGPLPGTQARTAQK